MPVTLGYAVPEIATSLLTPSELPGFYAAPAALDTARMTLGAAGMTCSYRANMPLGIAPVNALPSATLHPMRRVQSLTASAAFFSSSSVSHMSVTLFHSSLSAPRLSGT